MEFQLYLQLQDFQISLVAQQLAVVVTAAQFIGAGQIGIGTSGGLVGYGVSFLDFRGSGFTTAQFNSAVGIVTLNFQGGGGGSASIGVGSTPGDAFTGIITAGNLWYNSGLGRLFIYYQDDNSAQWVDAAPFNVGIITQLTSVAFSTGTVAAPSLSFGNDSVTLDSSLLLMDLLLIPVMVLEL